MTTLFSDTFESGNLSAWSLTSGTISAQAVAAHTGSFGCEANSIDAFALADFTAPASTIVSLRADVNIVNASGTGIFRIIQISTQAGGASVGRLRYNNGAYDLWMNNKDATTQTASVAGISTGTWLTLQIVYDWSVANPTLKAYVNSSLAATLTDTTSGTTRIGDRVFILTFEDTATGAGHLYFDNVLAEDVAPAPPAGHAHSKLYGASKLRGLVS